MAWQYSFALLVFTIIVRVEVRIPFYFEFQKVSFSTSNVRPSFAKPIETEPRETNLTVLDSTSSPSLPFIRKLYLPSGSLRPLPLRLAIPQAEVTFSPAACLCRREKASGFVSNSVG